MRTKWVWLIVLFVMIGGSNIASAQYRNNIFGLGLGYAPILGDKPQINLTGAFMLGGESLFKMGDDHWWFAIRLHLGARKHAESYPDETIGTLLQVQPSIAVRYVIATDKIRPFIQLGTSFATLITFNDIDSSFLETYLPARNWGTITATPGIEFVFQRNMSIQVTADVDWMILWSQKDAVTIKPMASILFYM